MIRFCWVHVSFNFVVVESSSPRRGSGLWFAQSSLDDLIFYVILIWNYKELVKLLSVRFRFHLDLQLWICETKVRLTSFLNCNWEFGKCFYKTTLSKGLFRFGLQVTSTSIAKMTSGFPLSSSFKLSRSTFKRLLVTAQHFISYMLLRGETTSQRIEFSLH